MADQGAIGLGVITGEPSAQGTMMSLWTGIVDTGFPDAFLADAVRNDASGNPGAPSQSHPRPGIFKDILWKVRTGKRTFRIDCRHEGDSPLPRIILKSNPALGIPADIIATVPSGTDWVTVRIEVAVYGTGLIHIWRERRSTNLLLMTLWDNIKVA